MAFFFLFFFLFFLREFEWKVHRIIPESAFIFVVVVVALLNGDYFIDFNATI